MHERKGGKSKKCLKTDWKSSNTEEGEEEDEEENDE